MKATLPVVLLLLCNGCSSLQSGSDEPDSAMIAARDEYTRCISGQAQRDATNPAPAQDIAAAAEGRCWIEWQSYRDATSRSFMANARSREEMQLAHDKADAHFRQFEQESRRSLVDAIADQAMTRKHEQ